MIKIASSLLWSGVFVVICITGCTQEPKKEIAKEKEAPKSIIPASFRIPEYLEKVEQITSGYDTVEIFKTSKSFDEIADYVEAEIKKDDWYIFNESRLKGQKIVQFCKVAPEKVANGVLNFSDLKESFTVVVRIEDEQTLLVFSRIDREMQTQMKAEKTK